MFVALRDLRFATGRFSLMGVVVALITLLVVMLSGLTAGLGRANTSAVTDLGADHVVFAEPGAEQDLSFSDSALSPAVQQSWATVPGVERADPIGISLSRISSGDRSVAVAVFAVPAGSDLAPVVSDEQVVLSVPAAEALGVGIGGRLELADRSVTVVDIAGTGQFSHVPLVWTALGDQLPTVLALHTAGADLSRADAELGTRTVTTAQSLSAIGSYAAENGSLQLMRVLLFAISALVIGAFFTVWTIQRTAEIAILAAIGASTGYLLKDALGQALILLIGGTAVGTGIAVGIGALVGPAVPFVLDLGTVLVPAVVMIALGLLGAAMSLRRITSVDPLTALGTAR